MGGRERERGAALAEYPTLLRSWLSWTFFSLIIIMLRKLFGSYSLLQAYKKEWNRGAIPQTTAKSWNRDGKGGRGACSL